MKYQNALNEEQDRAEWPEPTEDEPSSDQIEEWILDSGVEATDGCEIEGDGVCDHGHPSWLLYLGYM